jgi:threonine dehydrogenase-like Zn-dependent dehydrogenase
MRAIVYTAPQQVATVADWPEPEYGPHDVVVAMRAVGLCGSDLTVYDGHRPTPSVPWVMGHEGGGTVVAVGSEVRDRHVGQTVVIEPNYPCLDCAACRSGVTSDCSHRVIVGMNAPGLLAERVAVPARFTWPLPDGTPDELLACFEPLAVGRAALRRAGVSAGQRCLVVGAGSQGLFLSLSLQALGAEPWVTDPHEGRVALAEQLGARRAPLDGETYPHVLETSGAPQAFATALGSVASTGTVTLIGLGHQPVQLSVADVVRRGLTLRGSIIYDHPRDFADTRESLRDSGMQPQRTLNPGVAPEAAAEAFAEARSAPGKSWIDLSGWADTPAADVDGRVAQPLPH